MRARVGYGKKVGRVGGLGTMTSLASDGGHSWYAAAAVESLVLILSCLDGGVKPRVPTGPMLVRTEERGVPGVMV